MTSTALEASPSRGRDARPGRPLYAKLKPGPGRSSDEVLANQRARLRGAMIELSVELGYESVTIRRLARLAAVSTRSFYKHFANVEECFASTYEAAMQDALLRAYAAQGGSADWEEALRASLQSALEDFARYPKAAQLVLVEAFAAGPAMRTRIRAATTSFERLLADSFASAPETVAPRPYIARGIVAGTMRVARTRLLASGGAELETLPRELGDWMLSLPGEHAAALPISGRQPFGSLAEANGHEAREDLCTDILGSVGNEEGRILTAAAKLGATGGFSELTVPRIRARAGVSRRSFDARFNDAEECFLEAIEAIVASASARAGRDASEAGDWKGGIYSAIRALCTEAARNPLLARLALLDILAPGRQGLARRERLISLAANRLRRATPSSQTPTALVAEASVAAAWEIASAEIAAGRARELPRLVPTLAYVILAPAVGASTAAAAIQEYPVLGV